jgi:hypothetical protein
MTLPTEKQVADILVSRGVPSRLVDGGAASLLAAWAAFVEQAEVGYSFGLDDYRNDLDLRSLICLTGLDAAAVNDDARFRNLLTRTDLEVWSSDAQGAWWTFGYPANSGSDLLEDLRAEGIL